jgi:8-oxo-dGTP pyrophosphatase MutT (NUDIX family)
MLKKLTKISGETIHDNSYWKYKKDKYEMPSGNHADYYYVDSRGASFVIPYYKNKFVFVNQYRYLNGKESLEFPGGGIKNEISASETALNELREEAGLLAKELHLIGDHNPYNGVTNEICSVYYCDDMLESKQDTDESEEIEIVMLTLDEIRNHIQKNIIWDGMTLAAWSLFINSKYFRGNL